MSDSKRQHRLSLSAVCAKLRTAYQRRQLVVATNGTYACFNDGVRALVARFHEIREVGDPTLADVVRRGVNPAPRVKPERVATPPV